MTFTTVLRRQTDLLLSKQNDFVTRFRGFVTCFRRFAAWLRCPFVGMDFVTRFVAACKDCDVCEISERLCVCVYPGSKRHVYVCVLRDPNGLAN